MHKDLQTCLEMADLVWSHPTKTVDRTQISYKDIDNERWIVFEASDNWNDLLTHIQVFPKRINSYKAHSGFVNQYNKVRDILWAWVEASPHPLVFCGHSLGGAMAQIACADLGGKFVTTGCPKVWFGAVPNIDGLNFINGEDIVTKVPPFYKRGGLDRHLVSNVGMFKSHLPMYYKQRI